MLASDVANPEFQGAIPNPDGTLYVQFYWHEPIDKWESDKVGRPVKMTRRAPQVNPKGETIYVDTGEVLKLPFVRFMLPGDKQTIMEVPVDETHKRRWPQKWMAWQMQEGMIGGEGEIPGWKLEEWTDLQPDQVHELKYLRFSTVEQVAGASDAQVQRMGMGGLSLREKAKVALRNRMGSEVREEIARKDAELREMRERMAKLEAMMTAPKKLFEEPAEKIATETAVEREALVAEYQAKFNKKPHHKLSNEKIKLALVA